MVHLVQPTNLRKPRADGPHEFPASFDTLTPLMYNAVSNAAIGRHRRERRTT
jgi:hypothetical protein